MKRPKYSAICVFLLILLFSFNSYSQKPQKYEGTPKTDSLFIAFMVKNLGKIVFLNVFIKDGEFITEGYRGVQPYFEGTKTRGISYSFFLECPSKPTLSPIEECRYAKWEENKDGSGRLSGKFKVSKIQKTTLKNYRMVLLVPQK